MGRPYTALNTSFKVEVFSRYLWESSSMVYRRSRCSVSNAWISWIRAVCWEPYRVSSRPPDSNPSKYSSSSWSFSRR